MFDHVIRAAYFEADLSALIVDAACPALLLLREQGAVRGYVRSHWARGQHLDCVIAFDDGQADPAALDTARRAIQTWIDDHPSRVILPTDALVRAHNMADAEQWDGAIAPFYENNSVFLTQNGRKRLWASERLGTAAAMFHCDVLPDVATLIHAKQKSRGAFVLAAARRLAIIGRISASAEFIFWPVSLSAHAKLFLTAHPALRPTFESAWERLHERTTRSIEEITRAPSDPVDLTNWIARAASLDAAIKTIQADPDEMIMPVEVNNPLHIRDIFGSDERLRSGLNAMFDAERLFAVFGSSLHHRFRIIVNIFYESLSSATISPVERALACYILSRAILEDFPDMARAASEAVMELAGAHHA